MCILTSEIGIRLPKIFEYRKYSNSVPGILIQNNCRDWKFLSKNAMPLTWIIRSDAA